MHYASTNVELTLMKFAGFWFKFVDTHQNIMFLSD